MKKGLGYKIFWTLGFLAFWPLILAVIFLGDVVKTFASLWIMWNEKDEL